MKQLILLFIFLTSFVNFNYSQSVQNTFNGKLQITSVTNTPPTFTITGTFSNESAAYTGNNLNTGDKLYFLSGSNLRRLTVTSITGQTASVVTFVARDSVGNVVTVPTGQAVLIRETNYYGFPVFVSGVANALQAGIQNYYSNKVDVAIRSAESALHPVLTQGAVSGSGLASDPITLQQNGAVDGSLLSWSVIDGDWVPYNLTGDRGDIIINQSTKTYTIDTAVVTSSKIANGTIQDIDIANNTITGTKLASGAVSDSIKIANSVIQSSNIADGQVWNVDLASNAVDSSKVKNLSIPNSKILNVAPSKIQQAGATIGQALIWSGSVWAPTTVSGGSGITALTGDVTASGTGSVAAIIANSAVTNAKLANNSVTTGKIVDGTITGADIGMNTIPPSAISDAGVTNGQVMGYNGLAWGPVNPSSTPIGAAGGDLTGTYPNPSVRNIQGRYIDPTAPTNGQVLKWDGTGNFWYAGTDATGGGASIKLDNFRLPGISFKIPAIGIAANESVTNYGFSSINQVYYKFNTIAQGTSSTEYGGWLANGPSGDSIAVRTPYCVVVGDSQAEGHPATHGRLHPGGVATFTATTPDVYGQLSYKLRSLTKMRWFNHGIGGQTTTQVWARWSRDVLAQTFDPGDSRGSRTLPMGTKPVAVIIVAGINDPYSGISTATTIGNLENMARSARDNGIYAVFLNCPGDSLITQAQLKAVDTLNTYFASGALQSFGAAVFDYNTWWKSGSAWQDNAHRGRWITDDIHPSSAGYDTLATSIFNGVKLPVLDSIIVYNEVGPGSFSGFSRPTGITLDQRSYTIPNTSVGAFKVNYGLGSDSVFIKIVSSTNVSGTTYSGFSHILFKIANDTTGLSTRRQVYQAYQGASASIWNRSGTVISPSITDRVVLGASAANTAQTQLTIKSSLSNGNEVVSIKNSAGTTLFQVYDNNRVSVGGGFLGNYPLSVNGTAIFGSGSNYNFFSSSTQEMFGPTPIIRMQSTNVNTGGTGRTDFDLKFDGSSFSLSPSGSASGADVRINIRNKNSTFGFSVDLVNSRIGTGLGSYSCGVDYTSITDGIAIPRGNTAQRAVNGPSYTPIRWNTDSSACEIQVSNGDWRKFILSSSGVGGNTNFLAKFSGSSTIVNSKVFDNGARVGIGVINPGALFHVAGGIRSDSLFRVRGTNSTLCGFELVNTTASTGRNWSLFNRDNGRLWLTSNGITRTYWAGTTFNHVGTGYFGNAISTVTEAVLAATDSSSTTIAVVSENKFTGDAAFLAKTVSGDPKILFTNTTSKYIGMDQSDSLAIKIGSGTVVGANSIMRISNSGVSIGVNPTAPSAGAELCVQGDFAAEHFMARGGSPTASMSNAGSTGTSPTTTITYGGDAAFHLSFSPGDTPGVGDVITITFAAPFPPGKKPIVTWNQAGPFTASSLGNNMFIDESSKSNTGFSVKFTSVVTAGNYDVDFTIISN